jgi:uncharacterized protein (DUF58 family)
MIAVMVKDPRERELPPVGLINLRDAETGEEFLVDTSDANLQRRYREQAEREEEETVKLFRGSGIDFIRVSTDQPYVPELMRFFKRRERKIH